MANNVSNIVSIRCFGYNVSFSRRPSFACSIGLVPEGLVSTQIGEALAVATSPHSSTLSSEALVEAGVGTFEDFRTASRTLAVLLPFLGVAARAAANFDNPVMVGGLCSFRCYSVFELFASVSSTGAIVALTVTSGIISEAKGVASTYSTTSIFFVAGTIAVFSKECNFGR